MSRIWTYLATFAAGLALAFIPSPAIQSRPSSGTAVIFAPTGNDRLIHKALMGELGAAKRSIDIAIFNFTSKRTANVLKAMSRKVRIRVLADLKSAKDIKISVYKDLIKAGIKVKFVKLGGSGYRAVKFHHKFCVIDNVEVCTGSYNWTVQADTSNYENFLVIRDKSLAKKFTAEFEKIWKQKDLLVDDY